VSLADSIVRAKARLCGPPSKKNCLEDGRIREWVRYACERNGVPELAQAVVIEWSRRFTRRMGDAMYSPISFRARIRLSVPLWGRASEQDQRETVLHETCHVIVEFKFGRVAPHGSLWKEAMLNCGVKPIRTHSVDRSGLTRQRRFVVCDCPAEKKCRINAKMFNSLRRGVEFRCKVCGLDLDQSSSIEEDRAVQKSTGFRLAHTRQKTAANPGSSQPPLAMSNPMGQESD